MFEHKCHCRLCGLEAIYLNNKAILTEKEQKALEFTCNDCMWKILQERWQKEQPIQLALVF